VLTTDVAQSAPDQANATQKLETGQSTVKDWQAAVAAAGYQIVGPLYATTSDKSQPPTQTIATAPTK
jgi:hypothetical protein